MLTKEPSFASLLVKQSPAMHYGHGWITGENGKRWHPCHSQDELLSELTTRKRRKSKCMRQKVKWFISFVTEESYSVPEDDLLCCYPSLSGDGSYFFTLKDGTFLRGEQVKETIRKNVSPLERYRKNKER